MKPRIRIWNTNPCESCHKDFVRKKWSQRFCSQACQIDVRKPSGHPRIKSWYEGPCLHCKKEFVSRKYSQRFCSCACGFAYRTTIVDRTWFERAVKECPNGVSRITWISVQTGLSESTIVSVKRRYDINWGHWWKNEKRPYVPAKDLTAWAKAEGCIVCRENRIVDAAHIVPQSKGGPKIQDNAIPLCPTHHRLFDDNQLNQDEYEPIKAYLLKDREIVEKFATAVMGE